MFDEELAVIGLPVYVSEVVPVSAGSAPVVFEHWWRRARHASHGAAFEVVDLPGGWLRLEACAWERSDLTLTSPYRRVRGRLGARGWRAWPVEVELAPWSAACSEVGVRFAGRRLPRGRALERYHELALEVAHVLAVALMALEQAETDADLRQRRPDAA